jgi:hypothetical protein
MEHPAPCKKVAFWGVLLVTTAGFALQSFADYAKRIFVAIPNAL